MPNTMMDKLSEESTDQHMQEAISSEIAMCMKEPPPPGTDNQQKYCSAKAYGMARSKTGKELNYGK